MTPNLLDQISIDAWGTMFLMSIAAAFLTLMVLT